MKRSSRSLSDPDEIVRLSYLYDFYGPLLKEHHRQIFEDYTQNNLTLGEIARERDITRQGVYDSIRRSADRLYEYEERLQLLHKFDETKDKLRTIQSVADESADPVSAGHIRQLVRDIYELI